MKEKPLHQPSRCCEATLLYSPEYTDVDQVQDIPQGNVPLWDGGAG